jgi:hypothetical protein
MKKFLIVILLISSITTISNAKTSTKNNFIIENIPNEIKINKNQNNQEFEKEIVEIVNPSKNGEFKITVTFPDKETELEYVDYVFLDSDFNFVTTEDSYNYLTTLERAKLSSKVFVEPVLEQNGSIEYKIKTSDDKVLIGFIYKIKKNHFINSVTDVLFIDVEK